MESNGRKVRGRCVSRPPPFFKDPTRAHRLHPHPPSPQPMTGGPARRRGALGESLPGGARGSEEGLTVRRDGAGRGVRNDRVATPCAAARPALRPSVFEILNACGRHARNGRIDP